MSSTEESYDHELTLAQPRLRRERQTRDLPAAIISGLKLLAGPAAAADSTVSQCPIQQNPLKIVDRTDGAFKNSTDDR